MHIPRMSNIYLVTLTVNLLYVGAGSGLTWSSPALGRLEAMGWSREAALLASVQALGAVFGPLLAAALFPSRPPLSLAALAFLFCLSSALVFPFTSPPHFGQFLTGRVVSGLAVGATFTRVPVYLAEIADEKRRQAVTSVNEAAVGLGYLLSYRAGSDGLGALALSCGAAPLAFLALAPLLPASPYGELTRAGPHSASLALASLRSLPPEHPAVQAELRSIQAYLGREEDAESGESLRGLWLAFLGVFASSLTYICPVEAYMSALLEEARAPPLGDVFFSLANFAALLSPPLLHFFGLKSVFVVTGFAVALAQAGLGAYYFYVASLAGASPPRALTLVPVALVVVLNACFCAGIGPLAWVLAAELTPPRCRAWGPSVVGGAAWLVAFLQLLLHPYLSSLLGPRGVFLSCGVLLSASTAVCARLLPDTGGRTLRDIQDSLRARSSAPAPVPVSS